MSRKKNIERMIVIPRESLTSCLDGSLPTDNKEAILIEKSFDLLTGKEVWIVTDKLPLRFSDNTLMEAK